MKHLIQAIAAAAVAFVVLFALLGPNYPGEAKKMLSRPGGGSVIYLPIVMQSVFPTGTYYCEEFEFGLIWTSEAIALNADGSSVYSYTAYSGVVTGTWVFTPSSNEVGFTNFRWPAATFLPPDRLWASKYITDAGFEIALGCIKTQASR